MMSGLEQYDSWRLSTPRKGVKYRRMTHGGSISFDSGSVTEEWIIRATDLEDLIRELFPLPEIINGIPIYSYMPLPGTITMTASTVDWEAFPDGKPCDPFNADPEAPTNTYTDYLKVSIKFDDNAEKPGENDDPTADENDPETFLEIGASSAGEFIHSPMPSSTWLAYPEGGDENDLATTPEANTNPNPPATIIVPETEWTLTWPKVNQKFFADTFISRLRAIMGKVNSDTFPLLYNAPAETLLFVGWEMSESRQFLFNSETSNLQVIKNPLRVTMKVLEKRVELNTAGTRFAGHQHVWRPGAGWQKLLIDGSQPIYKTYAYNNLFAVTPDQDETA